MAFLAMLILAYGPLNWTFPWWVWVLGILSTSRTVVTVKNSIQSTYR